MPFRQALSLTLPQGVILAQGFRLRCLLCVRAVCSAPTQVIGVCVHALVVGYHLQHDPVEQIVAGDSATYSSSTSAIAITGSPGAMMSSTL